MFSRLLIYCSVSPRPIRCSPCHSTASTGPSGFHDGFQWVVAVLPLAGARLAKTLVLFVVPYSDTDFAATMEEPALGGARRVQVTLTAVLPVTIWTVVAIENSLTSGRTV